MKRWLFYNLTFCKPGFLVIYTGWRCIQCPFLLKKNLLYIYTTYFRYKERKNLPEKSSIIESADFK